MSQSKIARHLAKLRRDNDVVVEIEAGVLRDLDIVIPVMGPTGVGKSTFINNILRQQVQPILGQQLAPVRDSLESCTQEIQPYYINPPKRCTNLKGRRIVLVDTPGFDDTYIDDSEILRRIGLWLATAYHAGMTVGGVVYLYAIFPGRMTQNDRHNLSIFERLCGTSVLSNVIFGTTKWSLCPQGVGESREEALKTSFWKDMVAKGSRMCRLEDRFDSAKKLLDMILEKVDASTEAQKTQQNLAIQIELAQLTKSIPQTGAGRELRRKLKELLEAQKNKDTPNQVQIESITSQIQTLEIPLSKRLMGFFSM